MNILMMPDFLRSNPYLNLLHDALTQTVSGDCHIRMADFHRFPFPVLRIITDNGRPHVLHLHWIINWLGTNSPGGIKSFLKFWFFKMEIFLLKSVFKINMVWTAHNVISHECRRERRELAGRKCLAGAVKKIICHSAHSREEISRQYRIPLEKIEVVSHGNYIHSYKNEITRAQSRRILNLHQDDFIYLFFGIIRQYKGLDSLIDSFGSLHLDSARLVIAGNSPDHHLKTRLMSAIGASKNILPEIRYIPDDDIQIFMNASDVVVLPYRKILTSGAAVLAMSFGKPIIGPAMGCLPEILAAESNFLFDPLQPESLKEAMMKAFNHRKQLAFFGEKNYQRVLKDSWDGVAEKTLDIYSGSIL